MARNEQSHEDLMVEATAFPNRVEIQLDSLREPIVIGFKRSGGMSIYFGEDPVYQFDELHSLRRVYLEGHPYRSSGTTLTKLTRSRSPEQTVLLNEDLSDAECRRVMDEMINRLIFLRDALESGQRKILRLVSADSEQEFETRIVSFIDNIIQFRKLSAALK